MAFIRKEMVWIQRGFTAKQIPCGVIKCSCGAEVVCSHYTNTCDRCGADYGMSGDRLAPRSQWGEETGEHWSDIIRADYEDMEDY